MVLPVSLLRWQVELLVEEIGNLTRTVVNKEEELLSTFRLDELHTIRQQIFKLGKVQLRLRHK